MTSTDVQSKDWRDRGLTNAERLIVLASYHRDKLGQELSGEIEELANEWTEEVDSLRALQSPTPDGVRGENGRRPDGPGLSPSVGLASDPAGSAASIAGASRVHEAVAAASRRAYDQMSFHRSAADRARDQRAEREDAQRPKPEAASPIRAAEALASLPDTPSSQDSGVGETGGWQSIETAPTDGTLFWALEERRGPSRAQYICWRHTDDRSGSWYWQDEADSEPDPTHWMPLPAAPRPSQREG